MNQLPQQIPLAKAPPIKCQGIKTKLVPFILGAVQWDPRKKGRWIEPFLGSGVVALNLAPQRAVLADANRHIIAFYQALQNGTLNGAGVRKFLEAEGKKLAAGGAEYYYQVRERFNQKGESLDFLFLNRSCFNGVMRFNGSGEFNVPFGHKPQRFSPSYITKIVNQVEWAAGRMHGKSWEFRTAGWDQILSETRLGDFVYLDPPYVGRHTDYFNRWGDQEAEQLAVVAKNLSCGYALSMWRENRYRKNDHLDACWPGLDLRVYSHFYHVGASESLRNEMEEALLIKPGFAAKSELPGRLSHR